MKVLLSTKSLCDQLLKSKLIHGDDLFSRVHSAHYHDGFLVLTTLKHEIKVLAHIFDGVGVINQSNARWDWVYDLVSKISDQPIVLVLHENKVRIIFDY